MFQGTPVVIVAAIGRHRALGRDGKLLWHIPDDLQRFRRLTLGHPVVLGRKTFESIVGYVGKPLPGRPNIVLSRDPAFRFEGVEIAASLDEALAAARRHEPSEIHIGGGASLYAEALPLVDRLHLTIIDAEAEADAFFPAYEQEFPTVIADESREWEGLRYRWLDLRRA